jgi:FlaA1/EpsC-like NDP-sugar epimerase
MLRKIVLRLTSRFLSKWVVLAIDTSFVVASVFLAYQLKFSFNLTGKHYELLAHMMVFPLFYLGFFLFFRTYRGIIRHTGLTELSSVFGASSAATLAIFIACKTSALGGLLLYPKIPLSLLFISYLLTMFSMMSFRMFIRVFYRRITISHRPLSSVVIFGAGELGRITRNTLEFSTHAHSRVVAFMDDNPRMWKKCMEGLSIHPMEKVMSHCYLEKHNIREVIIAISNLSAERKQKLVDLCLEHNVEVKTVPPVENWINGRFSVRQIQKVKIEDLLHRPVIELDNPVLKGDICGRTVLVTGAAGSIGSGLSKLIYRLRPARLVLVDVAETPLFELEQYFLGKGSNGEASIHYHIADISDSSSMNALFSHYKPHMVYHAAAYKHVPMMELNPREAIRVNVVGTRVLARLSAAAGVDKFVFISTDKAVNPTSVMGASKRAAEIFVQSLNAQPEVKTRFITTRFGNVLGSNGSVIPVFEKQIALGGPVKVTHPDITRYFMTIPEACSLVLEAGCMGQGGEIFLFDMCTPVRIADVAEKMIRLSGLEPGRDIQIEFTGLRPGEKLFEELLADKERTLPTHHPKILIARVREYNFQEVKNAFDLMQNSLAHPHPEVLVAMLKSLIPEYVSNNSRFQALDKVG